MAYNVKLDAFEGPLDLLLHLINRLEIDIYDISVSQITDQYLDFIHTMQELQLDVAGEYLLMAATLLEIKSKMLLPAREALFDEEFDNYEEEDPREELIRRLVEYRKYKAVTVEFKKREAEWRLVFSKPPVQLEKVQTKRLTDGSLYDMVSALQKLIKRKRLEVPRKTKIHRDEIPMKERMDEIMVRLEKNFGQDTFTELYSYPDREQIVMTFLAVLELMKARRVACRQENNFTNIIIYQTGDGNEQDADQIRD